MGGTWEDFKRKHVLDPNEERGYESWDRNQWNRWLQGRTGPKFNTKDRNVNSVIISSPNAIEEDFRTPGIPYTASSGQVYQWSQNEYPIYLLERTNSAKFGQASQPQTPYRVKYYGDNMRFVARIEVGRPVHFHRQSDIPVSRGNINFKSSHIPDIP